MKLGLISATFATALIIGCAAHKASVPAPTPAPTTPAVTLPALPSVADAGAPETSDAGEPNVGVTPAEKPVYEAELSADGTKIEVKNDDWELDIPMNAGWRPVSEIPVEFATVNRTNHMLVLVRRFSEKLTLTEVNDEMLKELASGDGKVVPGSQKSVTVNGAASKTFKGTIGGGAFQNWSFFLKDKNEGITVSCGASAKSVAAAPKVCGEMIKHFYIGRSPTAE